MNCGSRLLSVLLLSSISLSAQQITGNISGTVSDTTGAMVEGATVTAQEVETGFTRTSSSDRNGSFVLVELPVGHYRVQVSAKNFAKYVQDGISLNLNETAVVTVRLGVGSEKEVIDVHADAELIQPTVTSMGKAVLQQELLDLPLDGRDFSQLGLLQPGVVPLTPGLLDAGGGLRNDQGYAVDGTRPESNNFLIDGASNNNAVDAGFVLKPPIDAIEEFRILTHNANAEFGQSLGSTTNIITRSGTNSFHGAAWEFLRNDAFDPLDYSTHAVQPLKQNQFGGTFGGPIVKDKTFFFGFYEGLRKRQGESDAATVPTSLERQGNFGQLCTELAGQFNGGLCTDPQSGQFLPNGQLYSFFTGAPTPVPNNQLPSVNPIAQNLLPFFPSPNRGGNSFVTTQSLSQDNNEVGAKIDHYLNATNSINFRYMYSAGPTTDPLSPSGADVPGFPVGSYDRAQNFVVQETHTFSSSLISVARFSFMRNDFLFDEHINDELPAALGFQYSPTLAQAAGPPFVQVAGYASVGDPITGPRDTYQNTYDVSGALSWIHGRHEMKFGGGFRRDQINALFGIASNGFFVFSTFPYSDGFASFLSGQPVVFLQGGGNPDRHIRGKESNVYAQDTYKVTSRLTANFGLRYELPSPDTETHNLQNLWEPGVQSKVLPDAPVGLVYPGDPGVPAGLIPTEKTAFAPRVGLAYDVTGSGKWLLSSAYGIFYEPYYTGEGGPLQDPVSAPPYLGTPQVGFPVNFASPFNGTNPFAPNTFSEPMTLLVLSPKLRLPYVQDWNLNLQHSFGDNWLLEIGYIGTVGVKLPRFIEGNPAIYVPGQSTENNVNQRRIDSGCTLHSPPSVPCIFASVGEIAGIANSNYNALQTSLHKRFSHGMAMLASYTYSHSIDDVSSFNITGSASQPDAGENDLAQNPFDLAAERGRSMFDARHRFVLSYEWAVPFWRQASTWYQHALGNWQFNGIVSLNSGTPFTVFDSNDVSLQGTAPEISGFSSNRPNVVGDPNSGPRTAQEWFNVAAFQKVIPNPNSPVQQFGDEGRNEVEGPGYADWDFSAFKNIQLTEHERLQFRAETFNFLNHTNFRLPESDIESPTFGQIHSDLGPRVIQLALKLMF
jgi:Carboxypeptidase regulatory-like domain/TonB dependent receptor